MTRRGDEKAALEDHLRELHLPTVRSSFEEMARRAEQETLSYERYLLELMERECQVRRQNRVERWLRQSKLPLEKDLSGFDLKRLPAKIARQVRTLLDGTFVDRKENVLAFGKPGSGKTHLLCAIGQELIRNNRKVYFSSCGLWEAIFKDPMTTAAAIDRLVHHSVILELNLPSYRMEQAKKSKLPPRDES